MTGLVMMAMPMPMIVLMVDVLDVASARHHEDMAVGAHDVDGGAEEA